MTELEKLAMRRNALLSYLMALLSPELIPDPINDSRKVRYRYLLASRRAYLPWGYNRN